MSPILVFTSDEAWESIPGQTIPSVHIAEFAKPETADTDLLTRWERVFSIRDEVLKALEEARNAKQIGSSLEAAPVIHIADATAAALTARGVTRPLLLATRFTMEKLCSSRRWR